MLFGIEPVQEISTLAAHDVGPIDFLISSLQLSSYVILPTITPSSLRLILALPLTYLFIYPSHLLLIHPRNAELVRHRDSLYLFFAEDRDDITSRIHSQIFTMDLKDKRKDSTVDSDSRDSATISSSSTATSSSDDRSASDSTCLADMIIPSFTFQQSIATDGAHGASFFVTEGQLMLAVANFGDRLGDPPCLLLLISTLSVIRP